MERSPRCRGNQIPIEEEAEPRLPHVHSRAALGVVSNQSPPMALSLATSLAPPPQPRGLDLSLPTCGDDQCNSRGTCKVPMGGGGGLVCDCVLGYKGEWCEDTVNESLSVSLTLGVLTFILGILLIAFIFAKVRQRQKRRRSELMRRTFEVHV
ncbi:unnamed protein product [Merluccius merluccius]